MPTFLVPHKSGSHRHAALALYRAILTQCSRLPTIPTNIDELRNLVRNRFRGFNHNTSHKQLKVAFEAGYEAVDGLDAAVAGDEEKLAEVLRLLRMAPRRVRVKDGLGRVVRNVVVERTAAAAPEDANIRKVLSTAPDPFFQSSPEEGGLLRAYASSKGFKGSGAAKSHRSTGQKTTKLPYNIFDAPVPKNQLGGTGKRHVPVLFNANHIPVLRFKKPQPEALTGMINARIVQRQKRHDLRHAMHAAVHLAKAEDRWDAIVHSLTGIDSRTREDSADPIATSLQEQRKPKESLWKDVPGEALTKVEQALDREKEKNRVMAQKMYAVVDRERELARLEMEEEETQQLTGFMDEIAVDDKTDVIRRVTGLPTEKKDFVRLNLHKPR